LNEYVLRTYGLTKTYSNKAVVDNVNMTIKKGDIYGFIGKNGAGKTTFIRMITGLVAPKNGQIEMFSQKAEKGLCEARRRLGCIIEMPALYLNMTAAGNMEHRRKLLGIPDKDCIKNVLNTVGLSDAGKKKVKNYSLGMKQRLGIAIALLGNPDFLILDEPINGLDPAGIVEIRDLLIRLNQEKGITILISSHILGELSKLVTCYGVICNGQLIEEFSAKELEVRCKNHLRIRVDNVKKASCVLETIIGTTNYDVQQDNLIRLYEFFDKAGVITTELAKNDVVVEEIFQAGQDLEDYFIKLMGGVASAEFTKS